MSRQKEYPLELFNNKILRQYVSDLKDDAVSMNMTYQEWLDLEEITDEQVNARLAEDFTITKTYDEVTAVEPEINRVGDYAMFRWDGADDINNGDKVEGQYLKFASSSGHGDATGENGSVWKCVGFSQGTSKAPGADENRNRTTMYVRIK